MSGIGKGEDRLLPARVYRPTQESRFAEPVRESNGRVARNYGLDRISTLRRASKSASTPSVLAR